MAHCSYFTLVVGVISTQLSLVVGPPCKQYIIPRRSPHNSDPFVTQVGEVPWRTQLSFYVNGKAVKVEDLSVAGEKGGGVRSMSEVFVGPLWLTPEKKSTKAYTQDF